jgi:hypothetical protein
VSTDGLSLYTAIWNGQPWLVSTATAAAADDLDHEHHRHHVVVDDLVLHQPLHIDHLELDDHLPTASSTTSTSSSSTTTSTSPTSTITSSTTTSTHLDEQHDDEYLHQHHDELDYISTTTTFDHDQPADTSHLHHFSPTVCSATANRQEARCRFEVRCRRPPTVGGDRCR